MIRFSRLSTSLMLVGTLAVAAIPGTAAAQEMMPSMLVQSTPSFTVVLQVGPAAQMMAPGASMMGNDAEVMVGQVGMGDMPAPGSSMAMGQSSSSSMSMGDHSMSGGTSNSGSMSNTMSDMSDMGMAVNHHLEVHITDSSGNVVNDVSPVIRIKDKSTGVSRDLNDVMAMYDAMMGPSDFHYGQNVWLPDGQYDITVMLGSQSALFRDVQISGGNMPMSMTGG
ncbi:MAG: hypothetical protein JO020_00165 [Chloroflexi bacterium]|nr:hypothetical protein [Chloroflexota bacterium]